MRKDFQAKNLSLLNVSKASEGHEIQSDQNIDALKQHLRDAESTFKTEMAVIIEMKDRDSKSRAED